MSFFVSSMIGVLISESITVSSSCTYFRVVVVCFVSTLILGAIIYFVTLMLINKSFRIFNKRNTICCIIYSVCAVVVLLGIQKDVIGAEKRVPATDEIAWAGLSEVKTFVSYDEEGIDAIRNLHAELIADKDEMRDWNYQNTYENSDTLTIKYCLKNGDIVTRSYVLKATDTYESDSYNQIVKDYYAYANDPDRIKENVIGSKYDNCSISSMTFSLYEWDDEEGYYVSVETPLKYGIPMTAENKAMMNDIYAALLKDIDEGNLEQTVIADDCSDNYYDDLEVELTANEGNWESSSDVFYQYEIYEDGPGYSYLYGDWWVGLNPKCTNTIEKLIEYGIIDSEDDLITNGEVNEYNGDEAEIY